MVKIFEVRLPARLGSGPPMYRLGIQTAHSRASTKYIRSVKFIEISYRYVPCTEVKCVKRESEITPSWVRLKPVVKSSSNLMTMLLIHPIRRPGLWKELLNSLAIPVSITWLDISIKSPNGPRFASPSFPYLMSFQMIIIYVTCKIQSPTCPAPLVSPPT